VSREGCQFYLGEDVIDDIILQDVLQSYVSLYFPVNALASSLSPLILDIGAHHGFVTIEMLRRYQNAQVIAVEPNPKAIKLIRKNLRRNNYLDRVEIVEAAIGSSDGVGFLTFSDDGSWADTTAQDGPATKSNRRGTQVRTLSLATILEGRQPTLVKCNAEGAEFTVFPQLFSLGIMPPMIILMTHAAFGSVPELLTLFDKMGYHVRDLRLNGKQQAHYHCSLAKNRAVPDPSIRSLVLDR